MKKWSRITKRWFDFIFSAVGILILSPLFLLIGVGIKMDSRGPVFFKQQRVGKGSELFAMLKFRTMKLGSDKKGLLTVGNKDPRITSFGYFLRKYKLDELPQLVNVFKGEMSLVGPRPEVEKYVNLYDATQREVLSVRPGLTDYASLKFINENELLESSPEPENYYTQKIMPEKLTLNLDYIKNNTLFFDIKIILKTLWKIISK